MIIRSIFLALLFGSFFCQLSTGDDLYFDPSPIGQDAVEGEPVTLRCDVSNRNLVVFYWTLDNKVVANGTRRYQMDSHLRIERVDRALDSGSFRCVATNVSTNSAVRSSDAILNILWISDDISVLEITSPPSSSPPPPSSSSSSSPTDVPRSLKCVADGNPEPSVDWLRNGVKLQNSDTINISKQGLSILGDLRVDWGVYSCRATNKIQSIESSHNFVHSGKTPHLSSPISFIKPVYINGDNDVILHCNLQDHHHRRRHRRPEWTFNDFKLDINSPRHVFLENGSLIIKRAKPADVGLYKCEDVAINPESSVVFVARVVLSYINEMSDNSLDPSPSTAHLVPIATARSEVKCYPPEGLPRPTLRWMNPRGHVVEGEGRIRSKDGVMVILNAEEEDSGVYRCVAVNIAGEVSVDLEVVVTVPPKVQRLSTVETVQEGESASFECKYSGIPMPFTTITWKKNGEYVETSRDSRMETTTTRLRIVNVLSSDEGSYGCIVHTRGHSPVHVHVAQLYVASRLKFLPMPSVVQLELGSSAQVPCFAEGKTPPAVLWRKVGGLLSPRNLLRPSKTSQPFVSLLPDHITSENGVLKFKEVRKEDVGLYVCFAVSAQGSINFTVKVEVIIKPHLTLKPLNITTGEMSYLVIDCKAYGEPQPSIEWIKNMRTNFIDDHRIKVVDNGSLVFVETHYEDIGWYSCNAFSETGFDKQEFYINVIDTNKPPPEVDFNSWSAQKMSLVTAGCTLAYAGLMVVMVTCCLIRRRRMTRKKTTMAEEIGRIQKDVASAFSSSSSKSEKLSSGAANENSQLMTPIPVSVSLSESVQQQWLKNSSTPSFQDINNKINNNFMRDRLQIISHLGRGSYGDIMVARLTPSNMSHFTNSHVVMVKMIRDNRNTPLQAYQEENYDQLENIYDDVYSVGNRQLHNNNTASLINYPTSTTTRPSYNNLKLLNRNSNSSRTSYNLNSQNGFDHRSELRSNSAGGSTRSDIYENFQEFHWREREREEFARDLELLRLAENQRCVAGLVGSCISIQPRIIVFEYSEKGNLRDYLQTFIPDQLPNMPFILTLDRQLHFCHQVALGMLRLNEIVNDNTKNFGTLNSKHPLLPLKHLSARNVFVTPCLDAKVSLDGPCFSRDNPTELDEDHIWHNSRPVLLRWSAPEVVSRQNQVSNNCICSLHSSSLSHSFTPSINQQWPGDVWSFGVTTMEIFTFAARPFPELNNSQVLSKLRSLADISQSNPSTISTGDSRTKREGIHAIKHDKANIASGGNNNPFFNALGVRSPLGCPEAMWQIINRCLNPVLKERPSFETIVREIESIIQLVSRSG